MSLGITEAVKAVKAVKSTDDKLRNKSSVNHMNTKTTKIASELADGLTKKLEDVAKRISKDRLNNVTDLRRKYGEEVGSAIASSIRQSYLLGLQFVEGFMGKTLELSTFHVEEMNKIIDQNIENFWTSVGKQLEETKIQGASGGFPLYNGLTQFLNNTANSMNFFALSMSTVTSFQNIFTRRINVKSVEVEVSGDIQIPTLVWISERDDRVCPICKALDGQEWLAISTDIPRPTQDTHIGCRCRLLPKRKGKVYNA